MYRLGLLRLGLVQEADGVFFGFQCILPQLLLVQLVFQGIFFLYDLYIFHLKFRL